MTALLSCENRGKRAWASLPVSAMCDLSASRQNLRTHFAFDAAVLWRSLEAARAADTMIEAVSCTPHWSRGGG
jgi:hypothetical protein